MKTSVLKNARVALCCAMGLLSACTHPQKPQPDAKPVGNKFIYPTVELRATSEVSNRFLSKSFDLIKYSFNEEEGFSTYPVLDMDRIQQENPWDPFNSGTNLETILAPEISNETIIRDPLYNGVENASETYMLDSLFFSLDSKLKLGNSDNAIDVTGKGAQLKIGMGSTTTNRSMTHVYRAYITKPERHIYFYYDHPSDFRYFLKERFVKHLKSFSAADLVKTYGTHLVTNYYLGAFSDLVVKAKSDKFTDEEMASFTASFLGAELNAEIGKKMENNKTSIEVNYRQGGSDYYPSNLLPLNSVNDSSKMQSVDHAEWQKQLRGDDGTFMSLLTDKHQLIPIPDLIPDLFLKAKYICGILHHLYGNQSITYVLTDPLTLKPVLIDNEYIYTYLTEYASSYSEGIYFGTLSSKAITEKIQHPKFKGNNSWDLELLSDGKWVISHYQDDTATYLCTDLQFRTVQEDKDNKRYFLLNPIPRSDDRSSRAWGYRLIKPLEK